jgi:hypothetical protein
MKKIKNVLINGCSFSRGPGSWPYFLQKKIGFDMVNLSMPAAGNTYIHNSTVRELAQRPYDLVLIMWSGLTRVDAQVQDINQFSDIQYTSLNQSKLNDWPEKIVLPFNDQDYAEKDWVFVCTGLDTKLQKINFGNTELKYKSITQHESQSLLQMISLQAILKQLGIPYLFSFYQNYQHLLKKHEIYKFLDINNVVVDSNIWDITKKNKWYADDGAHPNKLAHEKWSNILCQEINNKINQVNQ